MKSILVMSCLLAFAACRSVGSSRVKESLANVETERKEFTGDDAKTLMTTLKRLGLDVISRQDGTPTLKLLRLECIRGTGAARQDAKSYTACQLLQEQKKRSAEAESEPIYKILLKNGVLESRAGDVIGIDLRDVECLDYQMSRGVVKCSYTVP